MTVIAVDEDYGVATDSGVWGDGIQSTTRKFVHTVDPKTGVRMFAAAAGPAHRMAELLLWATTHGLDPDKFPLPRGDDDETLLVVYPDHKEIWEFCRSGVPFRVEAPYAVGQPAAAGAALALMLRGATAGQALSEVQASGRFDSVYGEIHSEDGA